MPANDNDNDLESELLFLVELAASETADEGQLRRLGQLLKQSENLRELYSRAWMLEVELRQALQSPGCTLVQPARPAAEPQPFLLSQTTRKVSGWHRSLAVAASVLLVATIGFVAGRHAGEVDEARLALSKSKAGDEADNSNSPQVTLASGVNFKLTKATQCVWRREIGSSDQFPISGVQGGERLELLEGFATFSVSSEDWESVIQIEGPAALVMTSEGLPELRQGKMLVTTPWTAYDGLSVGLPYAEVYLLPGSEVGVVAIGGTCEVHVFSGAASLKGLWGLDQPLSKGPGDAQVVVEGASLQLAVADDGSLSLRDGTANRGMFDVGVTVRGGELIVTNEYVEKVIAAKPVAYWRFEEPAGKVVPNTVQDRFHLSVYGGVRFDGLTGNRCLGFPMDESANQPRFLATKEAISGEIGDDYAIEFWMNPSHYHTGTLVTLVKPELEDGEPPQTWTANPSSQHGLLVEVGGFSGLHALMRPRKLRFVHRSEASDVGGDWVFSDRTYTVREWQHMVFSKSGDKLSIYRNGKKCGETSYEAGLPDGLIAVVGQISDGRFERPFYGRLDELAIYGYALAEDQILKHYEAVQFIGQFNGEAKPRSNPLH